jgi:hypothetical protein
VLRGFEEWTSREATITRHGNGRKKSKKGGQKGDLERRSIAEQETTKKLTLSER